MRALLMLAVLAALTACSPDGKWKDQTGAGRTRSDATADYNMCFAEIRPDRSPPDKADVAMAAVFQCMTAKGWAMTRN